jgi:hypothetical protein
MHNNGVQASLVNIQCFDIFMCTGRRYSEEYALDHTYP